MLQRQLARKLGIKGAKRRAIAAAADVAAAAPKRGTETHSAGGRTKGGGLLFGTGVGPLPVVGPWRPCWPETCNFLRSWWSICLLQQSMYNSRRALRVSLGNCHVSY